MEEGFEIIKDYQGKLGLVQKKKEVIKDKEVSFDLNKDGVVDKKDAAIAGKILKKVYKRPSRKKR